MKTKRTLREELRLLKDMRNMAALNRQCSTDPATVRKASSWEAAFDQNIRRLTIRLRL